MSRRSDRGPLTDMRDAAREAIGMFSEAAADALEHDRRLDLALAHLLRIVGEAGDAGVCGKAGTSPEIPREKIIGMRNPIVHAYDQVVKEIVHDTVTVDLPGLNKQLMAIVGEQ